MYVIVVPTAVGYLFAKTDVRHPSPHPTTTPGVLSNHEQGKYDMRGKLKGDTIREW